MKKNDEICQFVISCVVVTVHACDPWLRNDTLSLHHYLDANPPTCNA